MPPAAHNRVRMTMGGRLGVADSWSVSLGLSSENMPASGVDLDTWLSSISDDILGWWSANDGGVSSIQSNSTHLDVARAYATRAGQTAAYAVGQHIFTAPAGVNSALNPQQSAMVATLRSTQAGRSGRGRIYVPAVGAQLQNSQFKADDVNSVAAATAELCTAINGSTLAGGQTHVVVAGLVYPWPVVDAIRCDSIPDNQRPRRRKMVSTFFGNAGVTT